jgi:hypothetical protein
MQTIVNIALASNLIIISYIYWRNRKQVAGSAFKAFDITFLALILTAAVAWVGWQVFYLSAVYSLVIAYGLMSLQSKDQLEWAQKYIPPVMLGQLTIAVMVIASSISNFILEVEFSWIPGVLIIVSAAAVGLGWLYFSPRVPRKKQTLFAILLLQHLCFQALIWLGAGDLNQRVITMVIYLVLFVLNSLFILK